MPPVFWKGKLSPTMKIIVNMSNLIAWVTGNAGDTQAMKQRMKNGYEGKYSDAVSRYDELGIEHYTKIAGLLLDHAVVNGKHIIDVGCGTGILSLRALEEGASSVTCCDISEYMMNRLREKLGVQGFTSDRFDLRVADACELPFEAASFDAAYSSMVLGLVPDQLDILTGIYHVLKPGGLIALATHGLDHYWEDCDATMRMIPKRHVLGYRMEFFPVTEPELKRMLLQAGFIDVETRRETWKQDFETGRDLHDFMLSTTSAWWYGKVPPGKVDDINDRVIRYLDRNGITQLSQDVVFAFGRKPGS